jgi:hypothetical protein
LHERDGLGVVGALGIEVGTVQSLRGAAQNVDCDVAIGVVGAGFDDRIGQVVVAVADGTEKPVWRCEREGPSTDSMPTAPSCPMTEVATVCPFGMSSMNEIVPLWGK